MYVNTQRLRFLSIIRMHYSQRKQYKRMVLKRLTQTRRSCTDCKHPQTSAEQRKRLLLHRRHLCLQGVPRFTNRNSSRAVAAGPFGSCFNLKIAYSLWEGQLSDFLLPLYSTARVEVETISTASENQDHVPPFAVKHKSGSSLWF